MGRLYVIITSVRFERKRKIARCWYVYFYKVRESVQPSISSAIHELYPGAASGERSLIL